MHDPSALRGPEALDGRERSGTTLCGWTLGTPLGQGPVAMSWLAERGGQTAVVRVLREPFASNPGARSEWLRASWAANRFDHARVPKILEEGVDDAGAPVVVRRWVRGEDLASAVARGGIDSKTVMRWAEQLLDALELAHAHGIVHGAITPANVIITLKGSIRLVDFATTPGLLARREASTELLAGARVTPFSAPERRRGTASAPNEQTDIWSVAACLYFALTGRAPQGNAPSLKRDAPEIGEDLASVVDLALSLDPLARYDSAYAMLGDVRRCMTGRKPKLEAALAPVPSHGFSEVPPPPASVGPQSLSARSAPAPLSTKSPDAIRREWAGNVFLMVAIALLVGVATFVLVRERLIDHATMRAP